MSNSMTAQQIIQAGGIIPTGAQSDIASVDGLTARSYQHPAMGDRVVVRLVPEMLGSAEDLKLEYYGFSSAGEAPVVGYQKRQSLGFPAWALVNDPARASYALEVLKEWRKSARQGASRPGNAKLGFDEIGEKLGRSVPHFLPSFWEECGRLFLEVSNLNYAATYFTKARTAEKVHALKVDEDDRREAFLEFALAGAVPVKALSEYSKDLQANYSAQVAYQHFRELCLRRTLGGMPPWSSMLKELSRMAVSAGLKAAEEEKVFFQEILSSPALARSPVEFWVSAKSSLTNLCKDDLVCQSLLDLLPKFSGNRLKHGEVWLGLLRDWNVFRVLGKQTSATAWLTKNIGQFRSYHEPDPNPNALFQIVRDLAPQLIADGETVVLEPGWLFDLDLAELISSLNIPMLVKEPGRYLVDASRWAQGKGPERPKDPVHLSQDPKIQVGLLATLESSIGTEPFESVSAAQKGWREPRRAWLESAISQMATQALPAWVDRIDRLGKINNRALFEPYPELLKQLQDLKVGPALRRSLQGGLLEEWAWPALEEAMAELGKVEHWAGIFPYLVVANSHLAICVGADQIVDRHEMVLPKGSRVQSLFWVAGQFCVTYWSNHERHSYWSGQPNDVRTTNSYLSPLGIQAAWSDGVSIGRQWIFPGNFELSVHGQGVYSDGRTCWVCEYANGDFRLQEMDPRTGKLGRISLPSFFEEGLEDGRELSIQECSMYPIPSELGTTPLGGAEGLYACRVLRERNQSVSFHHQEGTVTLEIGCGLVGAVGRNSMPAQRFESRNRRTKPCALIQLPDGTLRSVVYNILFSLEDDCALSSSESSDSYWLQLPVHWWHMMRPRNLKASRQLRNLDLKTVENWLSSSSVPDLGDGALNLAAHKLVSSAQTLMQQLTDFLSRHQAKPGTSYQAIQSHDVRNCLQSLGMDAPYNSVNLTDEIRLLQEWVGSGTAAAEATTGDALSALGSVLPGALQSVLSKLGILSGQSSSALPAVLANFSLLRGAILQLSLCAGRVGTLLWRSLVPGVDPSETAAMTSLIAQWAQSPLVASAKHFRLVTLNFQEGQGQQSVLQLQSATSRFLLFRLQHWQWGNNPNRYALSSHIFQGLEYSPDLVFRMPAGTTLESERSCFSWDTSERLLEWVELAKQRGPVAWKREHAEALAAKTGLSYAESALLWCGLPFVDSREANFLPTSLREMLGLKAAEAKVARETFRNLSFEQRLKLFGSSLPEHPSEIWDNPMASVDRLASAWGLISGVRLQVDQDCMADLNALGANLKPDVMLKLLADSSGPLSKDGQCKLISQGQMEQTPDTFVCDHLQACLLYSLYTQEYGSLSNPLRQPLVQAAGQIQERLKNPDLLFLLGGLYMATPAEWENLKKSLGGRAVEGLDAVDNGSLVAVNARYSTNIYYRPSQPSHPMLEPLAARMYGRAGWPALEWFRRAEFQEILAELALPPRQGYAANPLVSCPQLVDEVARKQGLSQSAAVLYLQSLALAAPTTKNIQQWNGWSSKEYNSAAKELAEKQLLIEAKRARAGRNHFLPGAWVILKSPHLPIERWKLPLYHLSDSGAPPLDRILALKPLAKLFHESWARVCTGDGPAFSEVE